MQLWEKLGFLRGQGLDSERIWQDNVFFKHIKDHLGHSSKDSFGFENPVGQLILCSAVFVIFHNLHQTACLCHLQL